jgi:hypothetical protein
MVLPTMSTDILVKKRLTKGFTGAIMYSTLKERTMFKLLSTGNPKTLKGMKQGYMTYILHLAPANLSGYEVCPKRTAGCTAACLNTAGRGGMFKPGGTNTIQQARIR